MSITLSNADLTVTLPEDIRWTDRYTSKRMVTTTTRMLSGSNYHERTPIDTGFDVTLEGGSDFGWVDRATLEQLRALYTGAQWNASLGMFDHHLLTLNFNGTEMTVIFKDEGFVVEPILVYNEDSSDDLFIVKLFFISADSEEVPVLTFF